MGAPRPTGCLERRQQCAGHRRTGPGDHVAAQQRISPKRDAWAERQPAADHKSCPAGGFDPSAWIDPGTRGGEPGATALRFHGSFAPATPATGVFSVIDPTGATRPRRFAGVAHGRHQSHRPGAGPGGAHAAGPAGDADLPGQRAAGGTHGCLAATAGPDGHRHRRPLAAFRKLGSGSDPEPPECGTAAHSGRWPAWPQGRSRGSRRTLAPRSIRPGNRQRALAAAGAGAPPRGLQRLARHAGGGDRQPLAAPARGHADRRRAHHHPGAGLPGRILPQWCGPGPAPVPGQPPRL